MLKNVKIDNWYSPSSVVIPTCCLNCVSNDVPDKVKKQQLPCPGRGLVIPGLRDGSLSVKQLLA